MQSPESSAVEQVPGRRMSTVVHTPDDSQGISCTVAQYPTMTGYTATVTVSLKAGVLDPEAETTRRALQRLGFDVDGLRFADRFEVDLEAESSQRARERAEEMAERLLANPTIHDYAVDVEER